MPDQPQLMKIVSPAAARRAIRLAAAEETSLTDQVRGIIAAVRHEGDRALRRFTAEYDRARITTIRMPPRRGQIARRLYDDMRLAWERISRYHEEFADASEMHEAPGGGRWGRLVRPLRRVGIYVPGGTAPLFSTLLMAAAAARAAGVRDIAVATPPPVADVIVAAARVAGVKEIHQVGGAQAIAGLAYGTQSIRPVDKIVGPGNRWVTEAKRQVFGHVGIDCLAGPTELVIVADDSAEAQVIAADLLAQAEHDVLARPVLITNSLRLAHAVRTAVTAQLADLPRAAIAEPALARQGMIALCRNENEMISLANEFATEHLELMVKDPWRLAEKVTAAGAIFLGADAPEAFGDYLAGPNHVLPTSRSARFSGPLSSRDFVSVSSVQWFPPETRRKLAAAAARLARAEHLEGHARSLEARERKR